MSWLIAHGIVDGVLAIIIAVVGWLLWGFGRTMDRFTEQMKEDRTGSLERDQRMMEAQSKIADGLNKLAIEVGKDYVTRAEMGRSIAGLRSEILDRVRALESFTRSGGRSEQ